MKTKKNDQKKQTKKQQKEHEQAEERAHAAWVEEKKTQTAAMLKAIFEEQEAEHARRESAYGRWAPVVEALEDMLHSTFDVVADAVRPMPAYTATVNRVRDAVIARLCNEDSGTASATDVTFTASLLAQLIDKDFGIGVTALPNALIAALSATRSIREAFARF